MIVLEGNFMIRNSCEVWKSRKSINFGFAPEDKSILLSLDIKPKAHNPGFYRAH